MRQPTTLQHLLPGGLTPFEHVYFSLGDIQITNREFP
jgi:hypothetical protein